MFSVASKNNFMNTISEIINLQIKRDLIANVIGICMSSSFKAIGQAFIDSNDH